MNEKRDKMEPVKWWYALYSEEFYFCEEPNYIIAASSRKEADEILKQFDTLNEKRWEDNREPFESYPYPHLEIQTPKDFRNKMDDSAIYAHNGNLIVWDTYRTYIPKHSGVYDIEKALWRFRDGTLSSKKEDYYINVSHGKCPV